MYINLMIIYSKMNLFKKNLAKKKEFRAITRIKEEY